MTVNSSSLYRRAHDHDTAVDALPALNAERVICSTITLRYLPLDQALGAIADLGFTEIDLGALPGVCDHVPYELTAEAVRDVAATVKASGLAVRSVNADIGDLNRPLDPNELLERRQHAERLIELSVAIGSKALVLPNGAQSHEPIRSFTDDLALVAEQIAEVAQLCADRRHRALGRGAALLPALLRRGSRRGAGPAAARRRRADL